MQSSADARRWIAGLEQAERERTGIKGLRVGFNKVFGYYLQVSHAYKGEVPAQYIRRQTLTDGERYITPELKEYENLVLHAQERIAELERRLFAGVQREIAGSAARLLATAGALARLDVLAGFAEVAVRRGYVRPLLDEDETLEIEQGRHPVVEAALEGATAQLGQPGAFVPNGCRLDTSAEQIALITGPNMAGKSTFLRSVALIVLMAQVGSFVPAAAARIGLVDRIFTRVGAQDDLAAGQSTFMVEMVETASILRHATRRAWSSWTRSAGGRAPTTGWPSPRPWWSTCTAPRGAADAVRHPLPRAGRPAGGAAPGAQLPRGRPGGGRPGGLPAPRGARPGRAQLRHPRRPPGRRPPRRHPARGRGPGRPGGRPRRLRSVRRPAPVPRWRRARR